MSVEAIESVGGFPYWKELLPRRTSCQPGEIATASMIIAPEAVTEAGSECLDPSQAALNRTISSRVIEFVGGKMIPGSVETDLTGIDRCPQSFESIVAGENITSATAPMKSVVDAPIGVRIIRPARSTSTRPNFIQRAISTWEKYKAEPKFGIREATLTDIPAMVDIDMRSFSKVYENYGQDPEEQRAILTDMFTKRYLLMGGKWMPLVTQKGEDGKDKIVGFMTSCPTSKDPADFISWEETTNDGKLDTLYDPNGKNAYVVTLSMDPNVKGQRGQNLLFVQQVGTMVREGLNLAFFESRMPGLRNWVTSQCKVDGRDIKALTEVEKGELAQRYFGLTRKRKGKEVPYDPLLKVYDGFGCKFEKVLPNAYKDEPSMGFGVLCTFENPTPKWVQKSKLARNLVGAAISAVTKSSWLSRKAFG